MRRYIKASISCFAFLTIFAVALRSYAAPKTIRVAIFSDAGVTKEGIKEVEHCLPASEGFETKTISAKEIRNGALKNVDVLIHGGGSASKQGEALGEKGRGAVKKFVDGG